MPTHKHLVIFGPQHLVEYYTSRALMLQGYPVQKYATKITLLTLLKNKEWKRLSFALMPSNLFKPLRLLSLSFPYPEPPTALLGNLEGLMWEVITIEVPNE